MRLGYTFIGFLLGLYIASLQGHITVGKLLNAVEEELTAAALTGYSEGWALGKRHTGLKLYWIVMDTQQELFMCYQREIERDKAERRRNK